MTGDHNMNQFTYGKAISGAEHNITQAKQNPEVERYKSQIERQCQRCWKTISAILKEKK